MLTVEQIQGLNNISKRIIGCAIEVHKELGAGLLESVYEACLTMELERQGLYVKSQVDIPLYYIRRTYG